MNLHNKFPFPPNGKVLGKAYKTEDKTLTKSQVSIPSERESAWQGFSMFLFGMFVLMFPFPPNGKVLGKRLLMPSWLLPSSVSIPSERESAWQGKSN